MHAAQQVISAIATVLSGATAAGTSVHKDRTYPLTDLPAIVVEAPVIRVDLGASFALSRGAYTTRRFAGDGEVSLRAGRPAVVTIRGNPLCKGVQAAEPGCDFVCALLERPMTACSTWPGSIWPWPS
mgnify:CR=1 FL=1